MASRLNPYLNFAETARPAMEFYAEVFGGELVLNTFGEYGQAGTPIENLVMHAMLETPAGFTLMGADTMPGGEAPGGGYSISLSGDDEAELRGYWDKLADGGTVGIPLEKQMWGDVFGQLTDKFGVGWMVNIAGESAG